MAKQSTIITDGTTEIELVWDSSSQPNWRLQFNERVEGGSPRPQWHRPQSFPPELIELASETGEARFRLNIRQDDDIDTVLNKIVELSRWIDGENQQAARYHTHGDVDRIELKVQRKNATNATVWPIIFGEIDDGGAHYTEMADFREWAEGVTIRLFLAPYGEAESSISLRNQLPPSPHMLRDSDGDGLVDGLVLVATPTVSQTGSTWLIGGTSQRFVTDASTTEGVRTSDVSASAGVNAVAYAWVRASLPADPLAIVLTDGSGVGIQSKTFDPASPSGYDKTATDVNGQTWYRYVVTGTNGGNTDFRLVLQRQSGSATQNSTYFVDALYLRVGSNTAPDAWSSSWIIANRNDPVSGSEDRINFVDVWGVPGDAPALMKMTVDPQSSSTGSPMRIMLSKVHDGEYLAAKNAHWGESDEMDTVSSGTGAWTTSTGTTDNHYNRFTEGATNNGGYARLFTTFFNANNVAAMLNRPRRFFVLARSNTLASTVKAQIYMDGVIADGDEVSVTATNTWELLDLGAINLQGVLSPAAENSTTAVEVRAVLDNMAQNDTFDIDAFLFAWGGGDNLLIWETKSDPVTNDYIIDGTEEGIYSDDNRGYFEDRLGSCWAIEPGNVMTRLIHADRTNGDKYDFSRQFAIELDILSRTRHLLGTT